MVEEHNLPADLITIIKNLYVDSKGVLKSTTASGAEISFFTAKGVKQGDGASPELFILFFDRIYAYI